MKIMDYFRGVPRFGQRKVLETIEREWSKKKIFVIQAPVATGKSRIAVAIADWVAAQGRTSAILTPTNILADQYAREFRDLQLLHKRSYYRNQLDWLDAVDTFESGNKKAV